MLKILMLILIFLKIATSEEYVVVTQQSPSHQQVLALEKGLANIDRKLTKLDQKVEAVENHLKTIDEKYNEVHFKLQSVEQRISRRYLPKDCKEALNAGNTVSGIYRIHPYLANDSFLVLCDMKTKGGGWTYVLNRFDGSQNFFLNWTDYRQGFGNLTGEFWLGLENLYALTGYEPSELLFEFMDWHEETAFARYHTFVIGNEEQGYNIKLLHGYSGNAGDSFSQHAGMKFTTGDKDQDNDINANCASYFSCLNNYRYLISCLFFYFLESAWWYDNCGYSDLCGNYQKGKVNDIKESIMFWAGFKGNKYSLKQTRMMVKPRSSKSSYLLPHEI